MNKQILSFVSLSVLALAHPVAPATAAPEDASSTSTEQSDRKFLSNLENADAAKAPAPAESAPATAPTFHTVNPQPREERKIAIRETTDVSNSSATENVSGPSIKATNAQIKEKRKFLANREAANLAEAPASAENAPEPVVKSASSQPREKPAQARVATKKLTAATKVKYRDPLSSPSEVADLEPAPSEAPVTTTTKVTVIKQPFFHDHDDDKDKDKDKEEHHGFFHRLFNHAREQQHPEDW